MNTCVRLGVAACLIAIAAATGVPSAKAQDRECALPALLPQDPSPTDASALHDIATGRGVTVAVIDTGVSPHPELTRVLPGADFVTPETPDPLFDCDGHGTVVAGIIAGHSLGIAPGAQILSIRQTSGYFEAAPGAEETAGSLETLAHAINDAVNHGADVINISVVSCVPQSIASRIDDGVLRGALERAEAEQTVVVAAAGNTSEICPQGSFVYPAHLPTVVSTGARESGYRLADYSVSGPADMEMVSAAGSPVAGLSHSGSGFAEGITSPGSDSIEHFAGTSFAAPVVSGIAATLRQRYPTDSAAEIRQRIYAAAEPADGFIDPHSALTGIPSPGSGHAHPVEVIPTAHDDDRTLPRAGVVAIALLIIAACVATVAGARLQRRA
ncbi:S8 family serine peptidase [Corynebacterium lubricantis]|uniref:S8 family serine peptidase n=1 Tax=Corynebacterium lubricantis TaxID=541095 RepID=UPI000363B54C|nr:S8 family serine peptidase [Corynebacterium lubricantis]